jgi:hypothetical protein
MLNAVVLLFEMTVRILPCGVSAEVFLLPCDVVLPSSEIIT